MAVIGKWIDPVTMEDVRLLFRNFSGKAGTYNAEGDRNFCVVLEEDLAQRMMSEGWNVKFLKARDEGDEPRPYIKVKVNFRGRPPNVVLITSRGRTRLDESDVNVLDYADIRKVDLIINPNKYDINGKQGISAYLKTIFMTLNEDELELKYSDVPDAPDSGQSAREYTPDEDEVWAMR